MPLLSLVLALLSLALAEPGFGRGLAELCIAEPGFGRGLAEPGLGLISSGLVNVIG